MVYLGFSLHFVALFIGGLGSAFEAEGASTIIGLGWVAVLLSIVGIVGSVAVRGKGMVGGF